MRHAPYSVSITFHRAVHVPIADLPSLSCDPYIVATVTVPSYQHSQHESSSKENPQNTEHPPLQFRTPTVRSTLNPDFDCEWIVAAVPKEGFVLTMELMDEDAGSYDDRLGVAIADFTTDGVSGEWNTGEVEYDVLKRKGGLKVHVMTYIGSALSKNVSRHSKVYVTVKVIDGNPKEKKDQRIYTLGHNKWSQHYSPIIGTMLGAKGSAAKNSAKARTAADSHSQGDPSLTAANFQANKLQMTGPVPAELRHPYVGYRPFIKTMFSRSGIQGQLLNRAMRHQHARIYHYDRHTQYGVVKAWTTERKGEEKEKKGGDKGEAGNGNMALAERFLEMVQWGEGHRLYTYVIMLDGEWRFTETGDALAMEMLSKHLMHSKLTKVVAFSGVFYVQRRGSSSSATEGLDRDQRKHPSDYELIIDNDSGTYRPKKELLPLLKEWLAWPTNLGALGDIRAMDCFDKELEKMKEERKQKAKEKNKAEGKPEQMVQVQEGGSISKKDAKALGRTSSISSEEVDGLVQQSKRQESRSNDPGPAGADGNPGEGHS